MKHSFILQVLIGLVILNLNKGQQISQLNCKNQCTCSDICAEAISSFGCNTCESPSCSANGQILSFSFTCNEEKVSGTYDNSNQNLQYSITTSIGDS